MKVNINGLGHVTKMAAMAIKSKNLYNLFLRTGSPIILNFA